MNEAGPDEASEVKELLTPLEAALVHHVELHLRATQDQHRALQRWMVALTVALLALVIYQVSLAAGARPAEAAEATRTVLGAGGAP